jgi:hypothetical protein
MMPEIYIHAAEAVNTTSQDIDDTASETQLTLLREGNNWRIYYSTGGRFSTATSGASLPPQGPPPRPQEPGLRDVELGAAGRPLRGGCAGVTGS